MYRLHALQSSCYISTVVGLSPCKIPSPLFYCIGAIFGIGGAIALFFYRHKTIFGSTSDQMLESLRNSLLMNVVYGLSSRNIDNW